MVRLQELQRNFDTYLNGKEKTPSGLKKAIEEIAERVLRNDKPVFSWNKCEQDQEVEFSGYFNLGEIERIEIAADYSGETVNVYINIDDEQLVKEKIYDFFLKEIIENKITGQYIEEHTIELYRTLLKKDQAYKAGMYLLVIASVNAFINNPTDSEYKAIGDIISLAVSKSSCTLNVSLMADNVAWAYAKGLIALDKLAKMELDEFYYKFPDDSSLQNNCWWADENDKK